MPVANTLKQQYNFNDQDSTVKLPDYDKSMKIVSAISEVKKKLEKITDAINTEHDKKVSEIETIKENISTKKKELADMTSKKENDNSTQETVKSDNDTVKLNEMKKNNEKKENKTTEEKESKKEDEEKSSKTKMILLVVLGVLGALIGIGVAVFFLKNKKEQPIAEDQ